MGADQGVHVEDEDIAGTDAIGTSLVLAKAIEKIGFDLVLCGMASTDGTMGVVPAMLAERLGLPQVTLASRVETEGDQSGSSATATPRPRHRRDPAAGPSVTDQSGEARYPSFKGIMAAKKKPVETSGWATWASTPARSGLPWRGRGRGDHRAPAAHRRRDRQGRGRLGRHGAGRVPRLQEVHLRRND